MQQGSREEGTSTKNNRVDDRNGPSRARVLSGHDTKFHGDG